MDNKDKDKDKNRPTSVGTSKDNSDNIELYEEDDENNSVSNKKIWIFDIFDNLYSLFDKFIEIDDRLKWVSLFDILNGPFSFKSIKNDESIKEFIDTLLESIVDIKKWMENKRLEILDDDKNEFSTLISLNRKEIYSRIAYIIHKKYI